MMYVVMNEGNKKPKRTMRDRIEDLKLDFTTSGIVRNSTIRKVTKLIRQLDSRDTETIAHICDEIDKLDLCVPRYGKTIDFEDYLTLIAKMKKNGQVSELLQQMEKYQVCYSVYLAGSEKS